MIKIGLIGYGYWGPNLARNFSALPNCELVALADSDPKKLARGKRLYPGVRTVESGHQLLEMDNVDAVVIATPISTHHNLAKDALLNGKHVLIEKPMTESVSQATELVQLARKHQRTLMVDHTFIYTGAVKKLREMVDSGEMGEVYYYDSVRVNLGLFQQDQNVLWDLAPHDFSIMEYLVSKKPRSVAAFGAAPVRCNGWKPESVVYVTVEFEGGMLGHFHVNWLSPVKMRRTLLGCSNKMVVYDHLDPDNQIKIFDKGVDVKSDQDRYHVLVQYRTGDLLAPKIDQTEALSTMCSHFVDCIESGEKPLTDGQAGLRVVALLEGAQRSLELRTTVRLNGAWEKKQRLAVVAGRSL